MNFDPLATYERIGDTNCIWFVYLALACLNNSKEKCSVSTDHHSARSEASVVLGVEVPEDPLVPGQRMVRLGWKYQRVHDGNDGVVHVGGGGGDDYDHSDDDEDDGDGDISPSGSTLQIEPIEISKPTTIEPPVVIIIIRMSCHDDDDDFDEDEYEDVDDGCHDNHDDDDINDDNDNDNGNEDSKGRNH